MQTQTVRVRLLSEPLRRAFFTDSELGPGHFSALGPGHFSALSLIYFLLHQYKNENWKLNHIHCFYSLATSTLQHLIKPEMVTHISLSKKQKFLKRVLKSYGDILKPTDTLRL